LETKQNSSEIQNSRSTAIFYTNITQNSNFHTIDKHKICTSQRF